MKKKNLEEDKLNLNKIIIEKNFPIFNYFLVKKKCLKKKKKG